MTTDETRDESGNTPVRRLRACVEAWPECYEGGYNPACCRFPKSCSATVYDPECVEDRHLEPVSPAASVAHEPGDQSGRIPAAEQIEMAARAMALVDEYDGCFERLDGTDPGGEEPLSTDAEDAEFWRKRARAALAAAGVAPHAPRDMTSQQLTRLQGTLHEADADREDTAPSAAREKLLAEAASRAQKAFPHRNPYLEGGAYMGEERSRIPLREAYAQGYVDAAFFVAAPAQMDEEKLAEVIWEEQESRVLEGFVIHTPDTARSTARAVREYLDSLRGEGR